MMHLSFAILFCITLGVDSKKHKPSTIKVKEPTSAEPTTLSDKDLQSVESAENDNQTHEILIEKDVRRHNLNHQRKDKVLWKWDLWCQFQPRKGDGNDPVTKYFYDQQLDECRTFTFNGGRGNKNRFDSKQLCERYCKGATYVSIKEAHADTYCSLQPDAGLCLSYIEQLYFDVNKNSCVQFGWGGCGGNDNRFRKQADCQRTCKDTHQLDDLAEFNQYHEFNIESDSD